MNFELKIDDLNSQLENAFKNLVSRPVARRQILGAMAARFKLSCIQNLGHSGEDRPNEWSALSPKYARRVGRPDATLDLTGRLMRSIRVNVQDDYAEVFVDPDECVYAARHQWGDETMPKRAFFPMTETEITPLAYEQVVEAAQDMLGMTLNSTYVGPIY